MLISPNTTEKRHSFCEEQKYTPQRVLQWIDIVQIVGDSAMTTTGLRRVVSNAVSVLTSDVVNRGTTFVLYALVARYLNPLAFGQLSLALTFYYTFQVLAVAGLRTFLTREVAKDREKTGAYVVNGSMVVGLSSLLSLIIMVLLVRVMDYSADTASIIMLAALGIFPFSLAAICEAVFRGWEKMRYIAYANVPVSIGKVGLAFVILSWGYGLYELVMLLLVAHVTVVAVEWWLMLKHIPMLGGRFDSRFCLVIVGSTATFLGLDGITAIWSSLNIILLSKLASETEVGLYNAAMQMLVPANLIFQSVVVSVFPVMCRRFESGMASVGRVSDYLIEFLVTIAVPMATGLFFLADSALVVLYGKNFLAASGALRIMCWSLILMALTRGLGQVLLASLHERINLRIGVVNTVAIVVLGLVFISQYGLIGAAIATLLTGIINFVQHYCAVSRVVSKMALRRLVWKAVVAAVCMALYLELVRNQGVVLTVMSAGVLYAGALLGLTIWSMGGLGQLKDRYLFLWSE